MTAIVLRQFYLKWGMKTRETEKKRDRETHKEKKSWYTRKVQQENENERREKTYVRTGVEMLRFHDEHIWLDFIVAFERKESYPFLTYNTIDTFLYMSVHNGLIY